MSEIVNGATETARVQALQARDQLAKTLDLIEDKLNVPKRVSASYRENRLPWLIGVGAAAAVAIGLVAWAIFSDD
jgi:hypothetical protein